MTDLGIIIRLVMALALGGVIGLEREVHGRQAGLRTHILVCLASALMMIVSIQMSSLGQGIDPSRIAAQVVSGIGFLGAGTILRMGASVRGLTTAASLWTVAGIGLAVGAGFYTGALVTATLTLVTLWVLHFIEKALKLKEPERM